MKSNILLLIALQLLFVGPAPGEDESDRVTVGAIRWDAWIGEMPGYDVGAQVERSLGPKRWHGRLPFYAKVTSDSSVEVRANRASIMDQEIRYAADAGLDYWAFVMYSADNPQTKSGVDLFLKSDKASAIDFCMITQSHATRPEDIRRLVRYFNRPNYHRVRSGRPLLYTIGPQSLHDKAWVAPRKFFTELRAASRVAGEGDPYIVHLWGWHGAKEIVEAYGLDAISAYSLNFDDKKASFNVLAEKSRRKWDEWRGTGKQVIPLVTTGWDRRPRVLNPVTWEDPSPRPNELDFYYEQPRPAELEQLLDRALQWCEEHNESALARTVLIYAWNEFDEGGWVAPSLWPETGNDRLKALRRAIEKSRGANQKLE